MTLSAPPAASLPLLLDSACAALAHPGRRAILRLLAQCGPRSAGELASCFPAVSRSAVSGHLQALRRAGLISPLPRRRRRQPDPGQPLEVRALQALAESAVDGRLLRYRVNPLPLALLQAWLAECCPRPQ